MYVLGLLLIGILAGAAVMELLHASRPALMEKFETHTSRLMASLGLLKSNGNGRQSD